MATSQQDPTIETGYADEHVPMGGHAVLVGVFSAAFGGGLALAHRAGRGIPDRVPAGDIALVGVATHKLSRLLTKDRVTSFARAPFTRFEERSGHGEVEEHARGRGMRRAVGELLVCPFCVDQWVAGAFTVGYVAAPRLTRLTAAMFAAVALSDVLQLAYRKAEDAL